MKIAMIGHKRIPSREGGIEIVVEELSTRMTELGHQVDVYNRSSRKFTIAKSYKGVRIITVPTIDKKNFDALFYSFFATIRALFERYDIIHFHAEGPCAFIWMPYLFHIRTAVTIHGLDWQRSKWGAFAGSYLKFCEKMAVKFADEMIVLSSNMQKYFKDTYNRETKYIPNGIGETTVREPVLISEKYHLEKDGYILFLARIVPEKGLHYLLEAFQKVDTDKKLVIAGQPSHTNDYYNIIKDMAGKDSRIIFTGFVEGQEMEELFSNCCLYILPSDVEGMPISLLEAMSYGCTCLVSDIEENKEVIREYSNYFKRGDVSALKQELEKCLQQEKNSEVMEKRNEYIKSNFSWTNIVNETLELYSCYYSPGVKSKI